MRPSTLLRTSGLLALVSAAACDTPTVATLAAPAPSRATAAAGAAAPALSDEHITVSPLLAEINTQLAESGARLRIARAELLLDGKEYNGVTSTVILADDRYRGIDAEWVPGDPRRDGRIGVTYAVGSNTSRTALTPGPNNTFVPVSAAQTDAQIEEAMAAWRDQRCSSAPISRVAVPAGTDPDALDQYFRGVPFSANYAQPADIVQSGWQPMAFFVNVAGGPDGRFILGVTFTLTFYDADGNPTDIDGNGKEDIGLAEIYYNRGYAWGTDRSLSVLDFYSVLTHETGHALGLNHFGKIFATKKAAADGIAIEDLKYAPRAMMNAAYITGRSEIAGTDRSSFCQIWASVK